MGRERPAADLDPDNTNANVEARAHWVELAQSFKIPIRCVHFKASTRLCEHNDVFRALSSAEVRLVLKLGVSEGLKKWVQNNPEHRKILPPVAFRSFASRYVQPSMSEGFQDITPVNFVVRHDPTVLSLPRAHQVLVPRLSGAKSILESILGFKVLNLSLKLGCNGFTLLRPYSTRLAFFPGSGNRARSPMVCIVFAAPGLT